MTWYVPQRDFFYCLAIVSATIPVYDAFLRSSSRGTLRALLKLSPPFPSTSSNHWVPKFVSLLSNSSFLKVMLIYLSPSTYRQVVRL
jgi:hypothetical protein